jgi:hypothetical protein
MLVPQRERRTTVIGAGTPGRLVAPGPGATVALGEGLQAAGIAFDEVQDEWDVGAAKDLDAQFSSRVNELLYADGEGFMHSQGSTALDRRGDVTKQLDRLRAGFLDRVAPRIRDKVEGTLQARHERATRTIDRHTSGQRTTYLNASAEARIKSSIEGAIMDPETASQELALVASEISDLGARSGWSAETVASKIQDATSETQSGIVKRIAAADPVAAMRYLQDNKEGMNGSDVARLTGALGPAAKAHKGRNLAQAAFGEEKQNARPETDEAILDNALQNPNTQRRSIRTNNPGAINYRPWQRTLPGFLGVTKDDGEGNVTSVWRTPEDGVNAYFNLITQRYSLPQKFTLAELARKYSGSSDPRVVNNYLAGWEQDSGLGKNTVIDKSNPDDLIKMAKAMFSFESGEALHFNSSVVEAAALRATGRAPSAGEGLAGIEDPEVRRAALSEMNLLRAQAKEGKERAQDEARNAAFEQLEQGGTIEGISLDDRIAIGRRGMVSLRAYADRLTKGEALATDQVLYVELMTEMAENPELFADRDALEWVNSLDTQDWKKLVGFQATARQNLRRQGLRTQEPILKNDAAGGKTPQLSALRSAAATALVGVGLSKKETPKRFAKFERELIDWASANPGPASVMLTLDTKINNMLAQITLDPPGWGDYEDLPWFELRDQLSDEGIELNDLADGDLEIRGERVPAATIRNMTAWFVETHKREPTPEEIIQGLIEQ